MTFHDIRINRPPTLPPWLDPTCARHHLSAIQPKNSADMSLYFPDIQKQISMSCKKSIIRNHIEFRASWEHVLEGPKFERFWKYVTWCYVILLHIFGSPSFRVQTGTPGGGSVPRKVWRSFYLNQPKVGIIIQKYHEIEMPIYVPRSITDTTVTTLSALCHLFINLSQAKWSSAGPNKIEDTVH